MTDIGFYHLTTSTLERALPRLLEKVLESGARAVVMAGSEDRVAALDSLLWTYDPASFLPHGTLRQGDAERQPILLTTGDDNPGGARFLVLTDGATTDRVGEYERCFEMFDGRDEAAVAAARERWREYKEAGHELTYWRQTDRGGWEKQD